MAKDDIGFIITARKPHAKKTTENWLKRHGITLPIIYADYNGGINWWDYDKASVIAARAKAKIIQKLSLDNFNETNDQSVHFDNNPFIVRELRKAELSAVLVGGDNETS